MYLSGTGPAVRASTLDDMLETYNSSFKELEEANQNMEAAIAEAVGTLNEQRVKITKLEDKVKGLKSAIDAPSNRVSMGSDSRGKNKMITEHKGFDRMKPGHGDAAQWKERRFRVTTWLTQVNPAFAAHTKNIDKSTSEPEELGSEGKVKIGPDEFTTAEEWCSLQLCAFLVQKTEGSALAMVRNHHTHGKYRCVLSWYRVMWEAEGQVDTKKIEIREKRA